MPTMILATCPHCKSSFEMVKPPFPFAFVNAPHIMCNCINCQETFLKHKDFAKFVALSKETIAIYHQNNDAAGFSKYIESKILLMESEVISKNAIANLTVDIHKEQDVEDFIKGL